MRVFFCSIIFLINFFSSLAQNPTSDIEKKISDKQYSAAIKLLNKRLKENEKDTFSYFLRGKCYLEQKKPQESYDDFTKYIDMNPHDGAAYLLRGILHLRMKKNFDAINDFNAALKYGKDTVITSAYYHRGSAYLQVNSMKQAYSDFSNAYQRNPTDKYIRNDLAYALCYIDSVEKGIEMFKQLFREYNNDEMFCMNIGFFSMEKNDLDTALIYLNKAIAIKKSAFTYNNRGFLKYKMHNNKEAMEDINTSLKMDENNSYAYKNRAVVYIDEGQTEKACEDLRKARQLGFTEKYGNEVELLIQKHCSRK